jgi:hypothetical protein
MEAPQKIVHPREVHPVRNSSRYDSKPSGALDPAGIILECNSVTGATAKQRGIISNGVNIISYRAAGSPPCRPVRSYGLCLSFARPLEAFRRRRACPRELQHRRELYATLHVCPRKMSIAGGRHALCVFCFDEPLPRC